MPLVAPPKNAANCLPLEDAVLQLLLLLLLLLLLPLMVFNFSESGMCGVDGPGWPFTAVLVRSMW